MKVRIGTFSIDFNEEAIRTAKKEAYIRDTARSLAWTGLDEKTLTQRITEVYETVKPPRKKNQPSS